MMATTLRRDDGFTLIEVLVATAIAAIGFLGLAATHIASVRATAVGRNVSIATSVATESIETFRRLPYDEVVSGSPTTVTRGYLAFTSTATVAAVGTTSKKVTMGVTWTDQFGTHSPGVQLITGDRPMSRRGFTLLELLAAIGVASIALVMLASAVRSQGSSAIYQMGSADMQQNVRGALDLFRREVRMAGYGMSSVLTTTLPVLEVPAPGAGNLYRVNLRGNFAFAKSRVNATTAAGATTVALQRYSVAACMPGTPAKRFTVGERVSIESALLGIAEVRTITGYDAVNCTVSVSPALTVSYDSGSPVNEIQEISYRLDDANILWREDVVMADSIDAMQMAYVLQDGTQVADPAAVLDDLRSATISLRSEKTERDGLTPQAQLETEVRIRNLAIVRTPVLDNL